MKIVLDFLEIQLALKSRRVVFKAFQLDYFIYSNTKNEQKNVSPRKLTAKTFLQRTTQYITSFSVYLQSRLTKYEQLTQHMNVCILNNKAELISTMYIVFLSGDPNFRCVKLILPVRKFSALVLALSTSTECVIGRFKRFNVLPCLSGLSRALLCVRVENGINYGANYS